MAFENLPSLARIKSAKTTPSPNQSFGWIGHEERPVLNESFQKPAEALMRNFELTRDVIQSAGLRAVMVKGLDRLRFVFVLPQSVKDAFMTALYDSVLVPSIRVIAPASGLPEKTYSPKTLKNDKRRENVEVIRLTWHLKDEQSESYCSEEYGSEIEFWDNESPIGERRLFDDEWVAPRQNAICKRIRMSEGLATASLNEVTNFNAPEFEKVKISIFAAARLIDFDNITFPIDLVYTWVDSSDQQWLDKKQEYSPKNTLHDESTSAARYLNRDELKYSLRSVWMYAPWIRNIYIVTDDQVPSWLNDTYDSSIKVIPHSKVFHDKSALPTFNSHAIESQLHHIEGLAEHFIYLNDDMLFGRPVVPSQFFFSNGAAKHFRSKSRVPAFAKSDADTPVDQATKNSREILMTKFSKAQSQVFEHAPYALNKSIFEEIESEFPEEYRLTYTARFRSPNDLNIPSHLAHYWGYLTGRSFPSKISFTYIGLAVRDVQQRLNRLLTRRNVDAFCINDTFTDNIDLEKQFSMIHEFMEGYFPYSAPWEQSV